MRSFVSKNLLIVIFFIGLLGLASDLFYNQNREVLAQTGGSEVEKLSCKAEVPIGEAIDQTEALSQNIIDNLKNILNNSVSEIGNARTLTDYTDEASCSVDNCHSYKEESTWEYCSEYTCGYDVSCDTCESDEGGGGYPFKMENFYGFILYDESRKNYLIPEVFAHTGDSAGCYPAPTSPSTSGCECGGSIDSISCDCNRHCIDCGGCKTCESTINSTGPGDPCPLNQINPIMNNSGSGSIKNDYQKISTSYNALTDLIEKEDIWGKTEADRIIENLNKSRIELKKCTVTKADYFEVLTGEKPGELLFSCEGINYLRKQEITVEISGKSNCYENNYYCCE